MPQPSPAQPAGNSLFLGNWPLYDRCHEPLSGWGLITPVRQLLFNRSQRITLATDRNQHVAKYDTSAFPYLLPPLDQCNHHYQKCDIVVNRKHCDTKCRIK